MICSPPLVEWGRALGVLLLIPKSIRAWSLVKRIHTVIQGC